jgi:hypothetical protein
MRELVSVFGLPDKPMEVDVPKDLVRPFAFVPFLSYPTSSLFSFFLLYSFSPLYQTHVLTHAPAAHHHNVTL